MVKFKISEAVGFEKPKWLKSKFEPTKPKKLYLSDGFPNWKKIKHPLEWLRQLFWCPFKIQKCTLVVDISKDEIDKGEGYVDCFEYLKWYLNNIFEKLNTEGYLDRYTIFHYHHKLHWP